MNYYDYLKSHEWNKKVEMAINHYGDNCVLCGSMTNIAVHHRTYKNLFNETVFDLIVLCNRCHKFVHQKLIDTSEYGLDIQRFIAFKSNSGVNKYEIVVLYSMYLAWCELEQIKKPIRFERFKQVLKRMYKSCIEGRIDRKIGVWQKDFYFNFYTFKTETTKNELKNTKS